MAPSQTSKTSWTYRRLLIFLVALTCCGCLVYLSLWGEDTELARTIVSGCFWLLGFELAFYVFGATFEDLAILRMLPGAAGAIGGVVTGDRRAPDGKES
jgi:Na+-translocating ferredoxin:NAD+ oxidoreductase RnfA subunit